VQCLLHDNHLEKLMLTDCLLSQDGFQSLLSQLGGIKRLRCLWLDGCQSIGISARKTLANTAEQALQQNVTLEFLQFPFGGFDEYMLELDDLLDLNRGGRRLLQEADVCPSSLWPVVLGRANTLEFPGRGGRGSDERRANILYFLLRQHNIMLER
jgi:hypothetical protein